MPKQIETSDYQGDCRRKAPDLDLRWWVMVSLAGIVTVGGAGWMTNIHGEVKGLGAAVSEQIGKLATNEANYIMLDKRLTRIEDKLDRALEAVMQKRT